VDSRLWTKLIRFVLLGVLCALLLPGELAVRAQTPDEPLTLEIIPAWEGYVRHSWWTEARAVLRNTGADWRGDLVIHDATNQVTYRQALELPAHSYKQYRLPLFVGNSSLPVITLRDTGGAIRQERRVPGRGTLESGRAVVVADTREALTREQLGETDALIWLPDLSGLPETPMAWDVIDVLLLNGVSTADLTAAQQEALLAWVAAGGRCIIGGGPALQQTLPHLPEALRIAVPGSMRQFASIPVEGTTLYDVAAAPLTLHATATPLALAEGAVVAAHASVGKGSVDIIGWDMAHPAGAAWLAQLWSDDPLPAISTINSEQTSFQALSSGSPHVNTLFRIPINVLPRFWAWLLLFPLYIFLMGPGTLLLVRRLKRPVLAWVFIPTWICGAIFVLALGLSSAFSQTFPLIRQVAMITVPDPALPARVVQGTAIYAPRASRLTWKANGIQRPLSGSYRFDSWSNIGEPFPVEVQMTHNGATIQSRNLLGVMTWATEGLYDSPDIATDLKLLPQENGALYVIGEIWSEATLSDVSILLGNATYGLTLTERISLGATASVSRPVTATRPTYGYTSSFCGIANYPSYAMYPSTPSVYSMPPASVCFLTGILEDVPFPAQGLSGIQHGESCLIYTIPCPTQPPGKLTIALEAAMNKVENGWIDRPSDILYIYAPGATLHYLMPAYMQIHEVEQLTVSLQTTTEGGASQPATTFSKISLWNWTEQAWVDYVPVEAEETPFHIVLLRRRRCCRTPCQHENPSTVFCHLPFAISAAPGLRSRGHHPPG
jgi:hypothetical protein